VIALVRRGEALRETLHARSAVGDFDLALREIVLRNSDAVDDTVHESLAVLALGTRDQIQRVGPEYTTGIAIRPVVYSRDVAGSIACRPKATPDARGASHLGGSARGG
jgi:hypothetical protein